VRGRAILPREADSQRVRQPRKAIGVIVRASSSPTTAAISLRCCITASGSGARQSTSRVSGC